MSAWGVACTIGRRGADGPDPYPASFNLRITMNNHRTTLLRTVKGMYIAVTGACWVTRGALEHKIHSCGGWLTPDGKVNRDTRVLVRGHSDQWTHGDYGRKEETAARYLEEGIDIVLVQDYEFRKLIESGKPARCSDRIAGQPIAWLKPPPGRTRFQSVTKIDGPLDREYTAQGRTEQAYLRSQLFGKRRTIPCSLCGSELPIELVVAAHIKPRSECSTAERRDAESIVFALCMLGCDALYERGFVSVDGKGIIVSTARPDLPPELKRRLRQVKGRRCDAWTETNADYFAWHYGRRFR